MPSPEPDQCVLDLGVHSLASIGVVKLRSLHVEESEHMEQMLGQQGPLAALDLRDTSLGNAQLLCEPALRPASLSAQVPKHLADVLTSAPPVIWFHAISIAVILLV